jgi:hypothetical protein
MRPFGGHWRRPLEAIGIEAPPMVESIAISSHGHFSACSGEDNECPRGFTACMACKVKKKFIQTMLNHFIKLNEKCYFDCKSILNKKCYVLLWLWNSYENLNTEISIHLHDESQWWFQWCFFIHQLKRRRGGSQLTWNAFGLKKAHFFLHKHKIMTEIPFKTNRTPRRSTIAMILLVVLQPCWLRDLSFMFPIWSLLGCSWSNPSVNFLCILHGPNCCKPPANHAKCKI